MERCIKCLTPETRPRVKFDDKGVCSACLHWESKKKLDWRSRKDELSRTCDRFRKNDGSFDVIVPGGGGKDSSYVAWQLKNEYGMNPLCVCATPTLSTELGRQNLDNFAKSGFNLVEVTSNPEIAKLISRKAFIKFGQPQLQWLYAILATPIRLAVKMGIQFIMYGEEAESEYGGSRELENRPDFNLDQIFQFYYSGIDIKELINDEINLSDIFWLTLPSKDEVEKIGLYPVHWSYYEIWDENKHLELALKKCGLTKAKKFTTGAYNDFSHLDQSMYYLHMYLAYLKFGFGRATTDASIDIRMGNITRSDGIKLVKNFDHYFPKSYLKDYLDYFDMNEKEFNKTCEKFRNMEIFKNKNGSWYLDDCI